MRSEYLVIVWRGCWDRTASQQLLNFIIFLHCRKRLNMIVISGLTRILQQVQLGIVCIAMKMNGVLCNDVTCSGGNL